MSSLTQTLYWQRLLNKYASLKKLPISRYIQEDGDFGPKSTNALKLFQKENGLIDNGVMLPETHLALTKACGLRVWTHPEVNCWIDSKGVDSQKRGSSPKKFIVLHHTVSGGSPFAIKNYFQDKAFATQFALGSKGDFVQCYDDFDYWSWHMNINKAKGTISEAQEKFLAYHSVAVEICNFGAVDYKNGRFYNAYDREISEDLLIDYRTIYGSSFEFRGNSFFEKYTPEQIKSLEIWIDDMIVRNKLSLKNDPRKIDLSWFEFDKRACNGEWALFTHTNVRKDKSDLHPQPEILSMLERIYKKHRG